MVIQRNMQAFNADRQSNMVEKANEKSSEKLSSGYKVNRSADDAAGLSISEKMRKQIRGLTRAGQNVEDGISLCQVIDGAMEEMHDMINRMNELCVQAANGTNSESDRADIQMEIDGIVTEFGRIIDTTKFNELYVFKEDKHFYIDTKGGVTVIKRSGKSLGEVDGVKVWGQPKLSDRFMENLADPGWRKIGTDYSGDPGSPSNPECAWVDFSGFTADSKDNFIKQLDNRGFDSSCCFCTVKYYGIKFVSKLDDDKLKLVTDSGINFNYHRSTQTGLISEVLKIDLNDMWDKYQNQSASTSLGDFICDTLMDVIDKGGKQANSNLTSHLTAYAHKQNTGILYILSNNKRNSVNGGYSTFSTMPRDDSGYIEENKPEEEEPEQFGEKDIPIRKKQIFIHAGADAQRNNQIHMNLPTMTVNSLKLNRIKVLTETLATNAINLLTNAQKMISEDRSRVGAYQNRMEHTEKNLDNVVENTTASESRIRDTDMADEMVRYAGNNILKQAGQSMLSQANTRHQRVLMLLGA